MIEDEVADGVSTLYRISVVVKGIEKPRVVLRDE